MCISNTIAERLKQKRLSLSLTQRELAERAETTAATISAYEKGVKKPSIENIIKIATVLGISLDWLCGIEAECKEEEEHTVAKIAKNLIEIDRDIHISIDFMKNKLHRFDIALYIGEDQSFNDILKKAISTFFESWDKFKGLYRDGLIDDEVYNLWVEKELTRLSSIRIKQGNDKFSIEGVTNGNDTKKE